MGLAAEEENSKSVLCSNVLNLSVALIGDIVQTLKTSQKRVLSPSTDRRAALLSLTPIVLLATQT